MKELLIVLLAVILAQGNEGTTLVVQLSQNIAQEGDNVTLTCRIKAEDTFPPLVAYIHKIGDQRLQIGSNKAIDDPYAAEGRYSAKPERVEGKTTEFIYTLKINGVKPSDSGEWGCEIQKLKISSYDHELTIPVQPTKVEISTTPRDDHPRVLLKEVNMFEEGETLFFMCEVSGGYPKPNAKVMIGDDDITDEFNGTEPVLKIKGNPPNQRPTYYVLMQKSLTIDYRFHDKKLTCQGSTEGAPGKLKSMGVSIKLKAFKPQFHCPKTQMIEPFSLGVKLQCVVKASPGILPEHSRLIFYRKNNDNVTLKDGETDLHYTFNIKQDGNNTEEQTWTISLDRIYKQHYREYTLIAANDIGTTEYQMQIVSPAGYRWNSAEQTVSASAVLLVGLISCLLSVRLTL